MSDVILEEGIYSAKIAKAEWKESPYQVRSFNPKGECLSLWLDVNHEDDRKRLFVDIGIHDKNKLTKVMDCCGVSETTDLKGKVSVS